MAASLEDGPHAATSIWAGVCYLGESPNVSGRNWISGGNRAANLPGSGSSYRRRQAAGILQIAGR